MGVSFVLALILAQASPAAQATAPPVIIQVHSNSGVCTAIRDQVGPVVAALLKNDHTIVESLFLMQAEGSAVAWKLGITKLRLELNVSKIARTLQATSAFLSRPDPAGTSATEAAGIAQMREQLRAVAGRQLGELNAIDGLLETQQGSPTAAD